MFYIFLIQGRKTSKRLNSHLKSSRWRIIQFKILSNSRCSRFETQRLFAWNVHYLNGLSAVTSIPFLKKTIENFKLNLFQQQYKNVVANVKHYFRVIIVTTETGFCFKLNILWTVFRWKSDTKDLQWLGEKICFRKIVFLDFFEIFHQNL